MYGKLVDGRIQYPPKNYRSESRVIFNLTDSPAMMKSLGYVEIRDGTHIENIPDGKVEVPTYSLVEPVGTTTQVPMVDDEGNPMLDENGEQIITEQTTYDIPEAYIRTVYVLQDAPEDIIGEEDI